LTLSAILSVLYEAHGAITIQLLPTHRDALTNYRQWSTGRRRWQGTRHVWCLRHVTGNEATAMVGGWGVVCWIVRR